MNKQPIEKPDYHDKLDVIKIWNTMQGEGPFTGSPAVFIRLAGCNLKCPACDTDYTTGRGRMENHRIVEEALAKCTRSSSKPLVVLTGGEPFRQNIAPLCCELLKNGFQVQVETNGIYSPETGFPLDDVSVVCSPKTPTISDYWMERSIAFKYIIKAGEVDPHDGLPTSALGNKCGLARPSVGFRGLIYVQPLDEADRALNWKNTQAAMDSCLKFGYRMSLQLHKLIGLD
jgi:7-carboxy-7-deazaguanine synthase